MRVSIEWKHSAESEMLDVCEMKFQQCMHAWQYLLQSKLTLVEATGDHYWGSGLNLEQTRVCLLEFWPGKNMMGVTLHAVQQILFVEMDQVECLDKQKAVSP